MGMSNNILARLGPHDGLSGIGALCTTDEAIEQQIRRPLAPAPKPRRRAQLLRRMPPPAGPPPGGKPPGPPPGGGPPPPADWRSKLPATAATTVLQISTTTASGAVRWQPQTSSAVHGPEPEPEHEQEQDAVAPSDDSDSSDDMFADFAKKYHTRAASTSPPDHPAPKAAATAASAKTAAAAARDGRVAALESTSSATAAGQPPAAAGPGEGGEASADVDAFGVAVTVVVAAATRIQAMYRGRRLRRQLRGRLSRHRQPGPPGAGAGAHPQPLTPREPEPEPEPRPATPSKDAAANDASKDDDDEEEEIDEAAAAAEAAALEAAAAVAEAEDEEEEAVAEAADAAGSVVSIGYAEVADEFPHELEPAYFPSKIGGRPAWLQPHGIPVDANRCPHCAQPLTFLLQLYTGGGGGAHNTQHAASDPAFHRTLFLFTCRSSACHAKKPPDAAPFRLWRSQLPLHNQFYPSTAPKYGLPNQLSRCQQFSAVSAAVSRTLSHCPDSWL